MVDLFYSALQVPVEPTGSFPQLHPLSFGEGIALDPLPAKEIRWVHVYVTCSVQDYTWWRCADGSQNMAHVKDMQGLICNGPK